MNLKEYAEANGMTIAEAKKATGLTHWKQEVVETESKQEVKEPVIQKQKDDKRIREIRVKAEQLKRYLGERSIEYAKYVSCYRDYLPKEYADAKHIIDELL